MLMFRNIRKFPDEMKDRLIYKMIKNAQERLFEDDMVCILCNNPTQYIGAFLPYEHVSTFGQPGTGEERVIMFTICPHHNTQSPWTQRAIEKILINQRQ